jgi:DNA-binding GntR family transcriptional regulator
MIENLSGRSLHFMRETSMGLSTYIRDDIKQKVQSDIGLPCKLTLNELAEHYKVSLTPVRCAVSELIQEGILHKQMNGRLVIVSPSKSHMPASNKQIKPPLSVADWDRILVKEIMLASLLKEATYLREESLAQKNETGRSVIRGSLGRMAGAGLIEHVPRCGWLVHPIQESDVTAYLEIREALELKALDLSRPHLDSKELERILCANTPPQENEMAPLDNQLHAYFIEKSGNRYIQNFFRQYTATYYTAVFDYATPESSVASAMAAQHCRILEAVLAKHWAQARLALSEHIWSQQPVLKQLLNS